MEEKDKKAVFGGDYTRLKELKAKYDPNSILNDSF